MEMAPKRGRRKKFIPTAAELTTRENATTVETINS
jgi:hypothetical protein